MDNTVKWLALKASMAAIVSRNVTVRANVILLTGNVSAFPGLEEKGVKKYVLKVTTVIIV